MLHDLSNNEWRVIGELIPEAGTVTEARRATIRSSVNAILWRMRTGKAWRFIPRDYGEPTTVFRHYQQWQKSGVWRQITVALAELRDKERVACLDKVRFRRSY
jgi:transposase